MTSSRRGVRLAVVLRTGRWPVAVNEFTSLLDPADDGVDGLVAAAQRLVPWERHRSFVDRAPA